MAEIAAPIIIDDIPKIEDDDDNLMGVEVNELQPAGLENTNPFQAIIDTPLEDTPNQTAKDNQNLLSDVNNEGYARAAETAKSLGDANADDVYKDPKPYQQLQKKNVYDNIIDTNPGTAVFFLKPENVKIAGDSAEELGAFEELWKDFTTGLNRQVEGIKVGFERGQNITEMSEIGGRFFNGTQTPADEARLQAIEISMRGLNEREGGDAYLGAAAEQLPILAQILGQGAVRGMQTGIAFGTGAAVAGQLGPQAALPEELVTVPAATGVGFAVGMRAGTIEGAFYMERNLAFLEYLNFRDAEGNRLDATVAKGAATVAGTINAALESTGLAAIVTRIPGLKRLYETGGRTAVNQMVLTAVRQNPTLGDRVKKFATSYAAGVSAETITEVLQEVSVIALGESAKAVSGQQFDNITADEIGERLLESGTKAFQAATVLGAPGPTIQYTLDTFEARQIKAETARRKAAVAAEGNEQAQNSKLVERSKDVAEEHRADVFREHGIDEVTIDAERVMEYMQSEGDPDFAASLGLTEEGLSEALELGAEVTIDADGYAKLIGRETYSNIADHVRFDEDGLTAAEAKEFESNFVREGLEQFDQDTELFDVDTQVQANQIRQNVEAQLRAAGRSENEAQFGAQLISERYITRGERAGMSPLEMFERDNIRLAGPAEQQALGFDNVDLAIDRFRGGVPADQFLKLAKTPMIDTLVRQGGVDPAGRFAGELAARGITPKTNPRLFKKDGIKDADTLVQEELGFFDAEPATETGYVDPNLVVDAVEAEVGGTPYRSLAEQEQIAGYDANIAEISRIIDAAGLTAESSPQEIRAAVDAAVGDSRQFEQELRQTGQVNLTELEQSFFDEIYSDPNTLNELLESSPSLKVEGGVMSIAESDIDAFMDKMLDYQIGDGAFSVPPRFRATTAFSRSFAGRMSFEQIDPSSDAFKDWFKESKVVDENGEPLVVYHGSGADLTATDFAFDPERIGSATDAGHFGRGFYFARYRGEAGYYGPNVGEFYLSIQNPLALDNTTGDLSVEGSFLSWAPKLDAIGALTEGQKTALDSLQRLNKFVEDNVTYTPAQNSDGTDGFSASVEYTEETADGQGYGPLTEDSGIGPRGFPKTKDEALERVKFRFLQTAKQSLQNEYPGLGDMQYSLSDYVRTELGASELSEAAKAAGHDGIMYGDEIIAFDPEQIKSVDNRGTFDPDDPRVLFQSTGLRAGTEDLTAYGIEPDKRYKVRDIALALEARQRDKFGTVERNDKSEAASDKLSNWMADEVEFEYQNNPEESGVGWYSEKYQAALDKLGQFFPEFVSQADFNPDNLPGLTVLENTKNSRDFFTALLAITSDGQRVADNFRIAQEIYSEFRETGKLPVGDTKGARRVASVVQNIENLQTALDKYGPAKMHERLLRQLTVGEMNAELRAEGKAVIGGYTVDMVMPYSALIFGSKLGAFYANLMGASGYLTMDLWYTRTFNRYRGNMLPPVSGLNNALDKNGKPMGLARFKSLYAKDKKINKPWQEITDDQALTYLGEYQAIAKAKGFKNTTAIEKAANTLHKAAFTSLQEQPYNASDRKFMVTAVQKAQDKLRERGIDATIADIQAILWYYEKRLYGELTGAKPSDISYAEAVESLIRDSGREAGQGAESIVIEGPDGNLFEVVGQRGLESDFSDPSYLARDFQQPSRGSIELRAHETVIRLGKKADASTFLHENGHLFLEQLKSDAKEFGTKQLVDDWNITRNWWGSNSESIRREAIRYAKKKGDSESAAALDKMTEGAVRAYVRSGDLTGGKEYKGKGGSTTAMQYLTEAMHEQYARGFEDYLRTGQAPSVQLQSAFNRFRAWIVSVYSAIKRRLGRDILDVQFSPEVSETVDRLLASDTDIELVREQFDLKALFDSAEAAGMTPKKFQQYQLQVARGVEQSKTRQLKKHLNEVEREKEQFWQDESEALSKDISATVAQEPVYRALWMLSGQKQYADGTVVPNEFAIDRLDRKQTINVLQSSQSLARLPKVKGRVLYTTRAKETGVHPDVAASVFGFRDGLEMLEAVAAARPFAEVVKEQVDAQLKQKYGDMLNDGTSVEKAIESTHIDATAESLITELNALRESKDKMKPAFVRKYAQEKIGQRKISELRVNALLQAEKKYAKEAGKLFRQGDRLGAQRAKFRQLLNFYMAKEAIKARVEVTKGQTYFRRFTAKRKNYKTLAADYVDQIKQILANYQFGPRLSDKKRQSLLEFAEAKAKQEGSLFEIPPEIAQADGTTNYQDLTLDEFRTLFDTIKSIETQGRNAKTIEVEGDRIYIADAEAEILKGFEGRAMTKRTIGQQKGYSSSLKGRFEEWKDEKVSYLAAIDASLAKVEFLAFQIDGEKQGPFHKYFYQIFADAEARRNDTVAEAGKPVIDALENMPRKMQRELGTSVYVAELDHNFKRSEIMMMALNSGNKSNRDKLVRGSKEDVYDSAALTEDVLDGILDNLNLQEWQFIQTVWDSFESLYPQVEAVFRKENGRSPEKIEAVPFEREFNGKTYKFRGGYFPIMYSASKSAKGMDISEQTALDAMKTATNRDSVFSGMTKERNAAVALPIDLDINAIPHKLEQTAHYITHYEAVRTAQKLLRREKLNKAITQTMGIEYLKVLNNWMGAVAANQAPQLRQEGVGKVFKEIRTNATVAIMGFSFTTGLAQTLGLFTSADALSQGPGGKYNILIGTKWIIVGMSKYLSNPAKHIRMIKKLSGEMRYRFNNTDRDVSFALRQFAQKTAGQGRLKTSYKNFQRFSLMVIAGAQTLFVDYPTWLGAYNKALAEGKAPADAINYADSIIRTSQTAGGIKDLSATQMNEALAPFLMFYSFFNVLYNIERQMVGSLVKDKDVAQVAARVFMVMALPTIVENIYKDKWPDEDEDEDGEITGWDYAKWTAQKTAFFGVSSVPFLRDVAGGAMTGYGYSMTPMDSLGDSLVRFYQQTSKALDDEDYEMTESRWKSIIEVVGFGRGLPVIQFNRAVKTAFKMEEGENVDWYDWLIGYRDPDESAFKN